MAAGHSETERVVLPSCPSVINEPGMQRTLTATRTEVVFSGADPSPALFPCSDIVINAQQTAPSSQCLFLTVRTMGFNGGVRCAVQEWQE